MSIRLRKPVYTIPPHHYCDLLKEFYLYAIPLISKGAVVGYLAACRLNEPIKTDIKIFAETTVNRIINALKTKEVHSILPEKKELPLNEKQLAILKLLATGTPDKIIALEKGITINTVKYHKKSIFKKLDVECSIQAVVKCLKIKLLSIEEIDC